MFRFTIRDVLWLTALVAMGCAWWVDHLRLEPAALSSKRRLAQLAIAARISNGHFIKMLDVECPDWQTRYPCVIADGEAEQVEKEVWREARDD